MKISHVAAGVLALGTFLPVAAHATVAADPQQIATVLRAEAGTKADVRKDDKGEPYVVVESGGLNYSVFFYGCDTAGAGCDSIQFYASWTEPKLSTDADVEAWNKGHRFGRAYREDDGSMAIEMDLAMTGGMSDALFAENRDWWQTANAAFATFIYGT